jgi:hypothetical protein
MTQPTAVHEVAQPWRVRVVRSLLTYVLFIVLLVAAAPIGPTEITGDAFYFWYAGHLVVTGTSPYDHHAWAAAGSYGDLAVNVVANCTPSADTAECLWVYPPLTAWLFAPFALFDVHTGLILLRLFSFITAAVGVVLLGRWIRPQSQLTRALTICACVVSQPFVFDVHAGHFEGLGIIGLVLLAGGLNSRRALPVVLGALLLSLKPHLYILVAATVLVVLLRRHQWWSLAMTAATLTSVIGLSLVRYPEALSAMVNGSSVKAASGIGWATTLAFAGSLVPDSAWLGDLVVFAIAFAGLWVALRFIPRAFQVDALIAGAAALSLVFSPFVHPYDLMSTFLAFALALAIAGQLPIAFRIFLQSLFALTLAIGTWIAIVASNVQERVQGPPGALPVLALVFLGTAALAYSQVARRSALRARGPHP